MLRKFPPVVVLASSLGAGAAPAPAQPAPALAAPADDSTAARTLEQNRRVLVYEPPRPEDRGATSAPGAPAARADRARGAPSAGGAGRVGLAAGGRPGARGGD